MRGTTLVPEISGPRLPDNAGTRMLLLHSEHRLQRDPFPYAPHRLAPSGDSLFGIYGRLTFSSPLLLL